jgi:hypothetical protein
MSVERVAKVFKGRTWGCVAISLEDYDTTAITFNCV